MFLDALATSLSLWAIFILFIPCGAQVAFHQKQDGTPLRLDFIGRIEHFNDDFDLGVRPHLDNAHELLAAVPVCRAREWPAAVKAISGDEEICDVIRHVYAEDMEMWHQLPYMRTVITLAPHPYG